MCPRSVGKCSGGANLSPRGLGLGPLQADLVAGHCDALCSSPGLDGRRGGGKRGARGQPSVRPIPLGAGLSEFRSCTARKEQTKPGKRSTWIWFLLGRHHTCVQIHLCICMHTVWIINFCAPQLWQIIPNPKPQTLCGDGVCTALHNPAQQRPSQLCCNAPYKTEARPLTAGFFCYF